MVMAGTLFTTFGETIAAFYGDSFLADTMPLIITTYTDSFYTPIDVWIEDTVAPFVTENIGD
jgi:hypothetical protein